MSSRATYRTLPYVVSATITVLLWLAIANETIWPDPVDVLHRAAGLLCHDLAETRIISSRRSVRDGKVATCSVTVEEHLDAKDLVAIVVIMRLQRQLSVGCYIDSDV